MAEIRRLSSEIIGKIAAGEVVERPASVVKELVENAIDAGSTNVTVELRGGGVEYIRISDNGKGIPSGQIRLAFERHATSKLQREEQLYDMRTLGFRGEALASVAAVAKVTCLTRTQMEDFGIRCKVEGGEFSDVRQAASPVGTTLIVEDLFFNTPVRRKFLKKPAAEAGLVADYMLRLILSHPEISFRFVNQGKTVYHSMGDGKLESALFCIYGKDVFRQLLPVQGNQNGVLLSGFIGVGELSRGNRQQQSFFINGRYFRSPLLSRALETGCEGRVMIGKFPMCALFLEMPYQLVDVNVHPNKLEVRFQNELAVAEAVQNLVFDCLHQDTLAEKLFGNAGEHVADEKDKASFSVVSLEKEEVNPDLQNSESTNVAAKQDEKSSHGFIVLNPEAAVDTPPPVNFRPYTEPDRNTYSGGLRSSHTPQSVQKAVFGVEEKKENPSAGDYSALIRGQDKGLKADPPPVSTEESSQMAFLPEEEQSKPVRLLGIAFDTYWIFEADNRLLFVDQHAAHERILYDRMLKLMDGDQISQQLLSPRLVQLSPAEMALVEELSAFLTESGFLVEVFDERSVAVHAVPTLFGRNEDPQSLFLETLDQWQENRAAASREKMRKLVAQMACKHAIKGGDKLNEEEIRLFLGQMLQSDSIPTCPHGRPIVTEMTKYQLEKRFKRT